MLSPLQQTEFEQVGIVRLAGVFSEAAAREMGESVWTFLFKEYAIRPDDPATWIVPQPTGFQVLTRSGVFDAIATAALTQALDQLLGATWKRRKQWGAPLVTFPDRSTPWQVPSKQWHLDFPARAGSHSLPGARVLAFVAPVRPRGGGTLVLAGSHRLIERLVVTGEAGDGHSTEIRAKLAATHQWLRDLWSDDGRIDRVRKFMIEGAEIDGVTVRVVELTGNPGDAVLMHPWALHAPSKNCETSPRIMVSHSVFRTG